MKRIAIFRSNFLLKAGKQSKISLVKTDNEKAIKLSEAIGAKRIGTFTSIRILGIVKKINFEESERN